MKKFGFTLAEILITMGIVGVVAALVAPQLINSASNAKIGPTLKKAVSTFETASELLLNDEDISSLSSLGYPVDPPHPGCGKILGTALSKFMKIEESNDDGSSIHYRGYNNEHDFSGFHMGSRFLSDDGMTYYIEYIGKQTPHSNYPDIPNNQLIGSVYIDINGDHAPNKVAKDVFKFSLFNDGTLRPYGSKTNYLRNMPYVHHWDTNGDIMQCNANRVFEPGWGCAGSIFNNNMKVIYK